MYYPAYSVFLLNNSSYQNYYQTYMLEYIGQTLLDSVICGAVNMPVAVQYVLSSIIHQKSTTEFCKHNYELTLPLF